MRFALALLTGALLPALAAAQQPSPTQHCEVNRQNCIRRCTGADLTPCFTSCAENHAHCVRNPTATQRQQQQPRR
jgi:hypothetical protein